MKDLERRVAPGSDRSGPKNDYGRFSRAGAFAVLLLALTLSRTKAGAQLAPTENTTHIRGAVVNRITREPIARALVSSPDNRFATMSDNEGRFEFAFSAASGGNGPDNNFNGPVALVARKPGFLQDRDNVAQNFSSYVPGKDLTIMLVPEALIVGKVILPSSEAPDNIFLQIYRRHVQDGLARWVPVGATQSRSDGEFRFADLAAGTYKVFTRELLDRDPLTFDSQGQLYGYPPAYSQSAADFNSAGTIQVSAGMTGVTSLTLTRQPYYRVHIPVTNVLPDAGVNVNVNPAGRIGPGFSLGYNNRAQAIEGMLPNGTYTIEAFTFGQTSTTGLLTITVHGTAVQGPAMTLVPSASVRVDVKEEFTSTDNPGSITFGSGRRSVTLKGPRRYLSIVLDPADDFERRGGAGLRNPSGPGDESLVIENARPGRYWVRVNSSRGYAASVRSGNIDLQQQPLVVGAGGSTSPIEITMRDDTAEIEGTVEGVSTSTTGAATVKDGMVRTAISYEGMPAPAHIYCVPLAESSGHFTEVWVSPDGSFTSPPLAPGAYRVLAFDRPQSELEYRNPEAMQAYESKGPVVRLVGGQKEHVRLQLISSSE